MGRVRLTAVFSISGPEHLACCRRHGRLSRAALDLDCRIAQVSRSVSALEKRIGIVIFVQTDADGGEIIERLRPLMRAWQSFEDFIVTPISTTRRRFITRTAR